MAVSKESANAGRVAQHVRELEREVSVLKQLDHPNIVRYLVSDSTPPRQSSPAIKLVFPHAMLHIKASNYKLAIQITFVQQC